MLAYCVTQSAVQSLSVQLQVLHYNTKYGSYDEAISQEDGLSAFAFFFKVRSCILS